MNKKRLKKLKQVKNDLADFQWKWLLKQVGYCCVRCGQRKFLTRGHIKPLGKGDNTLTNIQPLCPECNQWQGQRTIDFRSEELKEAVEFYVQTWGKS